MCSFRNDAGKIHIQSHAGWSRSLLIAALTLLLSACAIPTTVGPSYSPSYPEPAKNVWTHGQFKIAEPNPRTIIMRKNGCFIRIKAYPQKPDLNISLSLEDENRKGFTPSKIHMADAPLTITDLDTGETHQIHIVQRDFPFLSGQGVDIHKTVDPTRLFPGFDEVPAAQRHYALALEIKRIFKGSLPTTSTIQLPDIQLGNQNIPMPPLIIKRYKRSGSGWWYAVANNNRPIKPTEPAGQALGGGTQVLKPADVWYTSPKIEMSAVFRGYPYTYDEHFDKNDKESEIFGTVYFRIKGSEPIRLTQPDVLWSIPGETQGKRIPSRSGVFKLRRFTTTKLSGRLIGFPRYIGPDKTIIEQDDSRRFLITVPNFHPKQFRLTLPPVTVNGEPWPILPITFTYHGGSVGLATWP